MSTTMMIAIDDIFSEALLKINEDIKNFMINYNYILQMITIIIKQNNNFISSDISSKISENTTLSHIIQTEFNKLDQLHPISSNNKTILTRLISKFNSINIKFMSICVTHDNIKMNSNNTIIDVGTNNYQQLDQHQLHSNIKIQDQLINYHNDEIAKILQEQKIINEIFKDIASLVNASMPLVDDFETNINDTSENIAYGNDQLVKANNREKTRTKMLILFTSVCGLGIFVILVIMLLFVPHRKN